jgi:hypothetical protein
MQRAAFQGVFAGANKRYEAKNDRPYVAADKRRAPDEPTLSAESKGGHPVRWLMQ